jgi:hypothetical protein
VAETNAPTNWLDVLLGLFWPLLAVAALLMFAHPISVALNKVAGGLGSAEDIEVGPIKLKFAADAARNLPVPSQEVATALAQLNSREIETLISHAENTGEPVCRESGLIPAKKNIMYEQESATYEHLFSLRLVAFDADNANNHFDWCRPEGTVVVWLTDFGKEVRRYLLEIVTKSVVISKS